MTMHFGYRNKNPGNIRPNAAFTWQGQTGVFDAGKSGKFLIFDTFENGVRAVARLIGNYPSIFGVDTLRGFFGKYAPAGDGANDPDAYAKIVAKSVGVDIDQKVDFTTYKIARSMLPAIFRVETGEDPYTHITPEQIDEGCRRAGNLTGVPVKDGYVKDESGAVKRENVEDSRTIKDANKGMKEAAIAGAASAGGLIAALKDLNWYVGMPIALAIAFGLALIVWRFAKIKRYRREDNEAGVR